MWPFKKTIKYKIRIDLSDSTPKRQIDDTVPWWDDTKPEYKSITPRPLLQLITEWRLKSWWKHMKPDWAYLREHNYRTICPIVPTSWFIYTSNNVCYRNDSEGTYG